MQMSRRGHNNNNHASCSNSNATDDRFTAVLQVFTNLQKAQAEQQAKVNEENAESRTQFMELMQRQQQPQQLAPQIVIGGRREQDPNSLVEKFIKRGAKEFHGNEDP